MSLILTLSCKDTKGIVAAVSGFLADHDGFILESAQFGDASTNKFFMRTVFRTSHSKDEIEKSFKSVADGFKMDWQLHDITKKTKNPYHGLKTRPLP